MFSLMHTHMRTHTQISRDCAAFGLYKMLTVSLFHTFTDLYCHLDPSGGFGHQEHAQLHVLHVQTHSCTHVTTHNHTPLNLTHKTWCYNEFYAVCHKSSDVHGNTLTHSRVHTNTHRQECCPDHSEDKHNISVPILWSQSWQMASGRTPKHSCMAVNGE